MTKLAMLLGRPPKNMKRGLFWFKNVPPGIRITAKLFILECASLKLNAPKNYPINDPRAFVTRANGIARQLKNDIRVQTMPEADPNHFDCEGLWDTGATGSVITQKVVDALGLSPHTQTITHGIHGPKQTPVYLITVILPSNVAVPDMEVTLGELGDFDVLLGMDVIRHGDFAITNAGGKTIWSFRVPPVEPINFVDEIEDWKKKKNKTFTKKLRPSHQKKPRNPKKKR